MREFLEPPPVGLGSMDAVAATLGANSELVACRQFGEEWFIRRTQELARPEDAFIRSAYVKGFPIPVGGESDAEKASAKDEEFALQKKLEAWVRALGVGQVKSLRMRREDKQPLPGSERKMALKGRGKFKVRFLLVSGLFKRAGADSNVPLVSFAGFHLCRVRVRLRRLRAPRAQADFRGQGA